MLSCIVIQHLTVVLVYILYNDTGLDLFANLLKVCYIFNATGVDFWGANWTLKVCTHFLAGWSTKIAMRNLNSRWQWSAWCSRF